MDPDQIRGAMEDPVAQRLLTSANPARPAYIALDGMPRVVPVGFHWNGVTLVIGTVPGSAKVTALHSNPAVALTIDTSPPTGLRTHS
jgi:nitroimidazol reductase NimA-like FMN-containing flavoprotein (pyridoxamine 5'-phosphate oxidase superfamily)